MRVPNVHLATVSESKITHYLLDPTHPGAREKPFSFCGSVSLKELESVALTSDLAEHGLKRGDVGAVVLVHGLNEAYEVEFVAYDGHTVALVTLESGKVRPLRYSDIPHARELSAA